MRKRISLFLMHIVDWHNLLYKVMSGRHSLAGLTLKFLTVLEVKARRESFQMYLTLVQSLGVFSTASLSSRLNLPEVTLEHPTRAEVEADGAQTEPDLEGLPILVDGYHTVVVVVHDGVVHAAQLAA